MGEPARATISAGAILARRYRLETRIASGGMGTVYRATHLALGHDVALKVLHERALHDDAVRRFAREAKIAASLGESSRHVARVIDYGVEGGRPFLVMELLRGEDLRERLDREPRLPPKLVVEIVRQLASALEIAHELGVVHRDVKPANVFLAQVGTARAPELVVKLMDFGVATLGHESSMRGGLVLGTPAYMAPEQILGQAVDARADLWALGALTYRMLTATSPFGAGTITEVGARIIDVEPAPPSALVRGLPKAIDAWMNRALAKDPEARFASATELADELADALQIGMRHPALRGQRSGVRRVERARTWPLLVGLVVMTICLSLAVSALLAR